MVTVGRLSREFGAVALVTLVLATGVALAGERVVLELSDGARVEGELLKRDARQVVVLVGGQAMSFEAGRVQEVKPVGPAGPSPSEPGQRLYSTARRQASDVQALVDELGQAIAVVKTPSGLGTGWFVNPTGYLVTNHHVVAGERTIKVTVFPRQGKTLGRKVYRKVRIVALNAEMDLALLKVEEALGFEVPRLHLGDSRRVKVGDKAFAIGNPLGLERSTSEGIVSKVGRNIGGRLFLQTTAPIAPGNSGGPLFNNRGEVIGVVSRGAIMLDGLGFAIPSEYVKEFLDNLEAFAYDEDNPNTGTAYLETPVSSTDRRIAFTAADFIRVGHGLCCLNVADLDGDRAAEVVFADNNKAEIGILRRRNRAERRRSQADSSFSDWDINQLPESQRFKLETFPVTSRVSSIAVGDVTGDKRPDVLFYGDVDGLSVLEARPKGGFLPVRKLDDVQVAGHPKAIRVADLDGDGAQDVFALGRDVFSVLWGGGQRVEYPLEDGLRSKVRQFTLLDVDRDGRQDVIFFAPSGHYGALLRTQRQRRRFDQGLPLKAQVSGPVRALDEALAGDFMTLDVGINRVRRLSLRNDGAKQPKQGTTLVSLAVESGAGKGPPASRPVDGLDLDADGRLEMLAFDQHRSEFVMVEHGRQGFSSSRSPGPAAPLAFRLHRDDRGRAVVFCHSRPDHLFGAGRIDKGRVSFPRPIHTEGPVQGMQIERQVVFDARDRVAAALVWFEKSGGGQVIRLADADAVTRAALEAGDGSIDVVSRTLTFGPDEKHQQARLTGRVRRLAFADFDGDERQDLVVFWAYSGKESLYLGLGGGRFREVIKQQGLVEDEEKQSLLVQDLDGDGKREVLQVQPGFVRVLRVDAKGRMFIARQLSWEHGRIDRLVPYSNGKDGAKLLAISGRQARVVRIEPGSSSFTLVETIDLTGVALGDPLAGDLDGDGQADLYGWHQGAITVLLKRAPRRTLESRTNLNAALNHFEYWDLHAADLDGDGRDEILLFDKRKAAMEILRRDPSDRLRTVFRHQLYTSGLGRHQKRGKAAPEQPREVGVGDLDANRRPDLVFVIHDRLAIYLQGQQ